MSSLIHHFTTAAWLSHLFSTTVALIMFEMSVLSTTLSLGKVHGSTISLCLDSILSFFAKSSLSLSHSSLSHTLSFSPFFLPGFLLLLTDSNQECVAVPAAFDVARCPEGISTWVPVPSSSSSSCRRRRTTHARSTAPRAGSCCSR